MTTKPTGRLSLAELRITAAGRWPELLVGLGLPAECLTSQNKPCPACGGQDRFSFTDKHGSGSFVCRAMERQGGDGFELVMHCLGCDLRGALAAVAELVQLSQLQAAHDQQSVVIEMSECFPCEFRRKLDSDSSRSWTVIPRQAGH